MQCGHTRYTAAKPEGVPQLLKVIPKMLPAPIDLPQDVEIQDVFRHLAINKQCSEFIATTIAQAYQEGRKVLVLTERTEHLDSINQNLVGVVDRLFVLHGRTPKKQRAQIIQRLNDLSPDAPRVLLATPASWWEKVLITYRSIPWFWLCRFRGRGRCNNTLAVYIESMHQKQMCASTTMLIQGILFCCGCGTGVSVVTRRWGM